MSTENQHQRKGRPVESRGYFDDVAEKWDVLRQSFFSERVREKALAAADVRAGQVAADIGAGTGFITEALVRKGVHVIAVDQSEAMLAEMKEKFREVPNVEYRVGEAEHLPIQDAGLDNAFANMYLHHVERPSIAIKEMVRLLKPEGRLIVTDLEEHSYEFLRDEHHDRWLGFRLDEVRQWFREAGLKDVIIGGITEQCCTSSCDGGQRASISIFLASGQK